MDDKAANIWTSNFESTLSSLTSFSRWLILLNLSITLNYITEYLQWSKQKELLSRYDAVIHQPWQPLQSFYEESMDSLAVYDQQVAQPLCKLAFSVDRHGIVPDSIRYVRKSVAAYGEDLTSISTAQENGTPFDELNKQQMMSLIGLISFSDSSRMDSLRQRLPALVELAGPAMGVKGPASGDTGPAAQVAAFKDFITQSGLRFRDYRTFGKGVSTDSLTAVGNYLDSNAFESLNTVNADKTQAFDKIKEFESGNSIGIPLTSVNVSLTQFVVVAGLINLCIILYFTILFQRTRTLWKKCADNDVAEAYFFNWTWGIRRQPVFVLAFTLFMAYMAVISLVFSFLIYSISTHGFPFNDLYLIGLFALLNVVAAAWVGVRYYRFKGMAVSN